MTILLILGIIYYILRPVNRKCLHPGHNYDTGASVGGTSDAAPQVTGLSGTAIEQRPACFKSPLINALVLVGWPRITG